MITLEKIDRELINIADDHILSNNIVGITVQIDSHGIAKHSALLIGVEGDYSLFHYDSYDVLLENPSPTDKWFFCKSLDFINAEEFSLNFLAHCMIIMNEDPPEYGFLFDGSYYTSEGKYFTDSGIRNFTTCVGFCIKVLAGFIQNYDGYFELGDWDEDSMKSIEIQASDYLE